MDLMLCLYTSCTKKKRCRGTPTVSLYILRILRHRVLLFPLLAPPSPLLFRPCRTHHEGSGWNLTLEAGQGGGQHGSGRTGGEKKRSRCIILSLFMTCSGHTHQSRHQLCIHLFGFTNPATNAFRIRNMPSSSGPAPRPPPFGA